MYLARLNLVPKCTAFYFLTENHDYIGIMDCPVNMLFQESELGILTNVFIFIKYNRHLYLFIYISRIFTFS